MKKNPLFFSIPLLLMLFSLTACNRVSGINEATPTDVTVEDCCDNPSNSKHYPEVKKLPKKGNFGYFSITTAEHGSTFYGNVSNSFGFPAGKGIAEYNGDKCFSNKEEALKQPLEISANGHELFIVLSLGNETKTFTLEAGENKILSMPYYSIYLYVVVS